MSAVPDDLGARWAEELRQATDTETDRSDLSWMTDNPDRMPLVRRR